MKLNAIFKIKCFCFKKLFTCLEKKKNVESYEI